MLRRVIDAHGGALPDTVRVVFANTGREHPKTLDFIQACSTNWGVRIDWVEYSPDAPGYAVVNHNSASRNGEPYAALIDKRNYLPNPVTRFCTQDLKIRTAKKFLMQECGWTKWDSFVGLRADEANRVNRMKMTCGKKKERWTPKAPLFDAGITKADVMAFWAEQSFDLGLEDYQGNCDLCFLKSKAKLLRAIGDDPPVADWWIEQEKKIGKTFLGPRMGGRGYTGLRDQAAQAEDDLFGDIEGIECQCTD